MTTRSFAEIVTDVPMLAAAKAIREWLVELSGQNPRLNESPNFFWGGTVDGLVLIEYYGGPSAVGTPYGSWICSGGGTTTNGGWLASAKARLGLEAVVPRIINSNGEYGPVWAITRDCNGNPLPKVDWRWDGDPETMSGGFRSACAFTAGALKDAEEMESMVRRSSAAVALLNDVVGEPATAPRDYEYGYTLSLHMWRKLYPRFAKE